MAKTDAPVEDKQNAARNKNLDLALEKGIIEKRGSWLSYKGNQLAQGRDAAKEILKADATLFEDIETAVKAKLDEESVGK